MTEYRIIARSILLPVLLVVCGASGAAQIGGKPGAYSRMGFGARGMGLGNATTALVSGDIVGYDNPALLPWAEYRYASASFGVLSLDRSLNFLVFSMPLQPQAGVSAGIINAGVSDIDGRDNDGIPTGALKTSENQAFLSFGVRTRPGLSLGATVKLLYYHLYTDMRSLTAGIDLGAFYPVTEELAVGATVHDINSKYKWDSSTLYGQQGTNQEDRFPTRATVGAAYRLPDSLGVISADCEFSNASTIILRAGAEIPLVPALTLRAGVDRIDLKEKGNGIRPAIGFTAERSFGSWIPRLHYAFVLEPFSPGGLHMISISVRF
jgi:hypothetical protein